MKTPEEVRAFNYDHHRRMAEMRQTLIAQGVVAERDDIDDRSYRTLLAGVPRDQPMILELGSSRGTQWPLLREWLAVGGELHGLDLYEPFVREAQHAGLKIELGYVENMRMFPDASFDLVCSRHVMEHLGDLEGGMAEILRVTKPGGFVAHVTPNMAVDNEPAHLNHLDAAGWEAAWVRAGLRVLRATRHAMFHGGEVHVVGVKP